MLVPSIYGGIFDYDAKAERLRTVNASLEDPAVWNDPKKAQELGKEKKSLDDIVLALGRLKKTPSGFKLKLKSWNFAACSTTRLIH